MNQPEDEDLFEADKLESVASSKKSENFSKKFDWFF